MEQVNRSSIIIIIIIMVKEEEEEVVVVVVFLQRGRAQGLDLHCTHPTTKGQSHRPAEEREEFWLECFCFFLC